MTFFLGFLSLILIAVGIALGLLAWRNLRTASRLGRPLSRIAKLQPGCRKVRGKVAASDAPLRSPASNKECVYYRLRVYQEKKHWTGVDVPGGPVTSFALGGVLGLLIFKFLKAQEDNVDYSWHTLLDEDDCVPLTIEDDSGLVEVDPDGAEIVTKQKGRIVCDRDHPVPSKLADLLLEEYDLDTVDDRGNFRTLHIMEEALLVGATVTVVGPVEPVEKGAFCFQRTASPLLVSEGAVGKQAQDARKRAIGLCVGAGLTLAVGLICLFSLFGVIVGRALSR
jgi:hypothetical protein